MIGILLQHEYGLEHLHKLKDSELKMTLVSRLELTKTILKTKSFDIEHFQTSLAMKQERRKETLMAKREAEFLQWKIPLMKKIAKEKVVYIAQLDYPGYGTYSISFFKNERIEIIETDDSIWWKGKSMDSGCEGFVPSSYVRSNLESIELFQYAMEDQHVPVPCIKELKSQLLTEDEKASLFLQSIDEDPMLLHALREAKKLKKEKITGKINWSSDSLSLYNLSASQCKEAIVMLSSGKYHTIALSRLSPESVLSLLPHILQENKSVSLYIWNTPLTHDCVLCLCDLMVANTSLRELIIRYSSVSDKGMACICKSLHHNSALTDFFVISNPHVTSISGQAFSELLLNNSKLTHLKVKWNMLPPKSLKLILQSLRVNKSLQKFTIDERSYEALVTNHTRKMDKRLTCD
ncbi:PREDICTED: uncharacterized protein LOC109584241 [Amphimedon queenslandica]|uniref:SH3 domain-containing protein n=1 Tax=Amphimedon queenslandica TaxID=400682 RepID=A0A1X7U9W9_AMPQE|nr:PREDICTED: uncharacterized protein LOC109584241 [Amphimedon queenslandica]|eukprot:XP_019855471.1 PREDICTED: uncharacterized protein LOC109584241 [Amphimedon queenslandica]